jgi:3D (Asp-Asp-Asp) domain-containing protein/peptidoglycan hydrolase CwlO-like protein
VRASPTRRFGQYAAVGVAALAFALLSAAAALADDPAALESQAERLRANTERLASRSQQALLELYSLETKLAQAESRLATLESRSREVERIQASARERLDAARRDAAEADDRLASRLRTLYVEGDVDPLAVLLGAESFDEAVTAFDGLGRVAADDRAIVAEVRTARLTLEKALRALAARRAELAELVAGARATRDALAQSQRERAAYVAELRGQQAFNGRLVASLLAQASAAQETTEEIAPTPAVDTEPEPTPVPGPPGAGTRMIVSSTGYCLRGTTATGMPTGWGTIAVDPAVIPLGTKMYVPGYGDGVAADTGPAVNGRTIDLWFPSCPQALAWGRRTVTITLE